MTITYSECAADAERHAQRNRQAALKLAAFALEHDRPAEWLVDVLAKLGLDQETVRP